MAARLNRAWRLAKRPHGIVCESDLDLREEMLPDLEPGDVLVRHIYLSLDPTNRIWMSDRDQYMPPVRLNDVMRGLTIGIIEESRDLARAPGTVVSAPGGWQDYFVGPGKAVLPIEMLPGLPLTAHLSVLGMTGLTAYFGLVDIGAPKPGETLVVSAAAGAVGSIAGQIGKIEGCRVVGIVGSRAKSEWITRDLGFDAAIDYKAERVGERLSALCPKGIDIDFENVGGEIFDAVLARLSLNARIVLCGLISSYNATEPVPGPYNFANVLMKRATIRGFIVSDFAKRYPEGLAALGAWVAEGKIKYRVDIADGLENAVASLNRLFRGENIGKLLVRVSPEP